MRPLRHPVPCTGPGTAWQHLLNADVLWGHLSQGQFCVAALCRDTLLAKENCKYMCPSLSSVCCHWHWDCEGAVSSFPSSPSMLSTLPTAL